jgi:hypothetical protein
MPTPIRQRSGKIAPEQLVATLTQVLQRHLPLKLKATRITAQEAWQLLAYAAVNSTSLASACAALPAAPSGNRLREVLLPALPPPAELQRQLNRLLRAGLHPSLWKKPRGLHVAIDLVLIPYHGQPQTEPAEVTRGQARAGTTHFHAYATATIVHDKRRYMLALRFVRHGEPLEQVVGWLLTRLKRLKLRLRRLYLDAGFAGVPLMRLLRRRRVTFLLPLPARGKKGGVRRLFVGRRSYWTTYLLDSHTYGTCLVTVAVVYHYPKGRNYHRGRKWLAYSLNARPPSVAAAAIFQWYRRRFGIESTYRLMNRVRGRTSSRSPRLRLLWVGLALLVVNLYVAVRQGGRVCMTRSPAINATRRLRPCWLARLIELIHDTIKRHFAGPQSLHLPHPLTFS